MTGVVVVHTTESDPGSCVAVSNYLRRMGYESNEVFDPSNGDLEILIPWPLPAKSLVNLAGGVETNRRGGVYQVEVIGRAVDVPNYDDAWYARLKARLLTVCEETGTPYVFPLPFQPYPQSYGKNLVRLDYESWLTVEGIIGHMHAPENCVSPDTPILGTDLQWRLAGALAIGDELVGFDDETVGVGNLPGRRYRPSVVERASPARKMCSRVVTTIGELIASDDHPWLVRLPYVKRGSRVAWVKTAELDRERHRIISVGEPWTHDKSWESGWLAGLLDADGHCFAGGRHGSWVGFGQVPGPILDEFVAMTERRGWTAKVIQRPQRGNAYGAGHEFVDVRILGGMWQTARVLGTLGPQRLSLKAAEMWQGSVVGKTTGDVAVLRVEPVGEQEIVSLQTSTRTYIAGGLLCHNTHGDPGALDVQRLREDDDMPTPAEIWNHEVTYEGVTAPMWLWLMWTKDEVTRPDLLTKRVTDAVAEHGGVVSGGVTAGQVADELARRLGG